MKIQKNTIIFFLLVYHPIFVVYLLYNREIFISINNINRFRRLTMRKDVQNYLEKVEANNLKDQSIAQKIRDLIAQFENEKLPLTIRERAYYKIIDLTKELTE
jgi:predicted nucleic acid-binding protein